MQKVRKRCYGRLTDAQGLEFRILGPLEVVAGGVPVAVGGAKARGLLAFLLLHRGEVVSRERLVDEVWGERPPKAVAAELRVYVAKLRKALRPDLIVTRGDGYALVAGEEDVDAVRFERGAREGSRLLAAGDAESAAGVLADALALWRGPVLADLSYEPWVQGEARRLDELRLTVLEERLEADLALGRHSRVVAELERLVAEQPYRERLRAQLMLALYRCGRQSEALELYREAVRLFAEELGIEPGPELRARERAILNHDPSLRLRELVAGNLPAPPNRLIGRRRELDELGALLARPETRLLTLTGPGGSGKTRLALELAGQLETELGEPAFVVELAALAEPALVVAAIARTLQLEDVGAAPLSTTLATFLRHRRLLLVLDNFEHLLDAGDEIASLLAHAPGVKVIATSRSPLRLRGEWRCEIGPLPIEDAVSLFVERARAVEIGFEPTPAVEALCRRLDGLPLALELAAARVSALTPAQIHARLGRRLDLLTTGARDAPVRQRTLRAAVGWSYELLGEEEQGLFARLAVFAGGCTLEAAERVCSADADALTALVEASLLGQGDGRYWMLETIREYALERLGEAPDIRRGHAEYFLALAERRPSREAPWDQAKLYERFDAERDNLRTALMWLSEAADDALLLRLASALGEFWRVRGPLAEGRRWLEGALLRASGIDPVIRTSALSWACALARRDGDPAAARAHAQEELELNEATGNQSGVADALVNLGVIVVEEQQFGEARPLLERAVELSRSEGGDLARALFNLGMLELIEQRYERADELLHESLRASESTSQSLTAFALQGLGTSACSQGKSEQAVDLLARGIQLHAGIGSREGVAECLEELVPLLVVRGDVDRAALFLAAAETLRAEAGISLSPLRRDRHEALLGEVRARLEAESLARAYRAAAAITVEEAARSALQAAGRQVPGNLVTTAS